MKKEQIIIGIVVGILSVSLISTFVVENKLSKLRLYFDTKIENQISKIKETAELTSRGAVDSNVMNIVVDCSNEDKENFDMLLSSLDSGLAKKDLQNLDNLFNSCGDIAAKGRATMVLVLENEIQNLNELSEARALLGKYEPENLKIAEWNLLLTKELEIKDLFLSLVQTQDEIISVLLKNNKEKDTSITEIQERVQKIQMKLSTATREASAVRTIINAS